MRTVCFADFWTSELHQQEKNQEPVSGQDHSRIYLYINPVTMTGSSSEDLDQSSISKPDPTGLVASSLQNGEPQHTVAPEVKGPTRNTSIQDTKYKRPPPRPPSLGSGSGMGLLFSSPPSPHTSSSVAPAAKRKEEGRGVVGEKEERKSASISPPPSRPPVPPQGRFAPPLPPAPLCRASSRKSSGRDVGDVKEREKGQNPATKTEREAGGEEQTGSKAGLQGEAAEQDNGTHEEVKRGEKGAKEEEKHEDDRDKSSQQCPPLAKRPSRPVPPPRKKPGIPDSPVGTTQPGGAGGGGGAAAGMRGPPPSPARRPDVSLYSPQGGTVIGTDLDSGSNSSTEEEGEHNQELEQNHK